MCCASAAARSTMKVVPTAASVTVGGRRAGRFCLGPGMAGAECPRGRPWWVELALPLWCPALAWALVWLRAAVAARRRVRVAAWRRSWVSAGLRARAQSGRGPWRRRGCSRWGRVRGPIWEVSPRSLGGGVLDEDVVVVADEVGVVVDVVESEAEERAVGDGGGPWAAGAGVGCWVLRVMRTRVRVRALGVCARFPW